MASKATEQPSDVFSYRGLARHVFQIAWPKALLGGFVLLIFFQRWQVLIAFAGLLALTIAYDAYRYTQCWKKHEELKRAYPMDYPPLLEEKLREHGAAALISGNWVDLRVDLKKRLGLEQMP